MAQTIACPGCNKRYNIDERHYDKSLQCKCGKKFRVPRPTEAAAAPPVEKKEKAPAPAPGGLSDLGGGSSSLWDDALAGDLEGTGAASESATLAALPKSRKVASRARSGRGASFELQSNSLMSFGVTLVLLGCGSLLLPHVGLQFKILVKLGLDTPYFGAVLSMIGAVLLFVSQLGGNALMGGLLAAGGMLLLGVFWLIPKVDDEAEPNPRPRNDNVAQRPNGVNPQPLTPRASRPTRPERPPTPSAPRPEIDVNENRGDQDLANSFYHTDQLGGPGGGGINIVDAELRPVVGFLHSLGQWDNENVVAELWPLYDRAKATAATGEWVVAAKEGYVVGGLNVHADKYVNAVQVIFMRLDGNRLVKDDHYESEWIGAPTDRQIRVLGGDGRKVLGIFGAKGLILNSLGLIQATE